MNTAGNAAEHGSALQGGKPVIDFTGRRVLIAGGSKGIGREMALAFAGAGARVSVCARGRPAWMPCVPMQRYRASSCTRFLPI